MIIEGKRYKGLQLHKVKARDEFMIVFYDSISNGCYDAYCTMQDHERLPCVHSSASIDYVQGQTYPMSYKQAPDDVKAMLRAYIKDMERFQ